jgi:hypothetical protein
VKEALMQLVAPSWTMEPFIAPDDPRLLTVWPGTFGGGLPRCRRCDILLGTQPCPNPDCRAPHGDSAGDLCTWCRHEA